MIFYFFVTLQGSLLNDEGLRAASCPFKKENEDMNKIKDIEDKIEQLKKLKLDVETKLARELYKKIETMLGNDFSYQLAITLIDETWNNASEEQKGVWLRKANSFLPEISKKTPKDSQKINTSS